MQNVIIRRESFPGLQAILATWADILTDAARCRPEIPLHRLPGDARIGLLAGAAWRCGWTVAQLNGTHHAPGLPSLCLLRAGLTVEMPIVLGSVRAGDVVPSVADLWAALRAGVDGRAYEVGAIMVELAVPYGPEAAGLGIGGVCNQAVDALAAQAPDALACAVPPETQTTSGHWHNTGETVFWPGLVVVVDALIG